MLLFCSGEVFARRVNTNIKVEQEEEMVAGSFLVTVDACDTCNSGYSVEQLVFSGFDKPLSSVRESFFITNTTDCRLINLNIDIEYITLDSMQLHKRTVEIPCDIPPGETRKIDIKSWDNQKSFYYYKSAKPRRNATSFDVRFYPISITLQFPE